MARQAKKSVYERITDKLNEIKEAEETLQRLHDEVQDLYTEKDQLEMEQLLSQMKSSGLTIDKALALLHPEESEKVKASSTPKADKKDK